jgi:hypothetical protein
MLDRSIKRLSKKARRGMRGYPIGVVACYGPDNKRASKLVASVQLSQDAEQIQRKWFAETGDVRHDPAVTAAILAFFEEHGVLTVGMQDRIIGCPHEEGIDYEGEYCPQCAFWIGRDRWTGKLVS